ncbi:MAG TPA: DUF4185 domain-containing protein [Thermoanaerobaculia bacterium]|nr:DUF4185 domain-containing protein [Thermoanaerobaculia bacterium]
MTLIALSLAAEGATTLTWIPGSTVKVEQMIGECDYAVQAKTGQCTPTSSRTITRAKVVGTDIGSSFESQGKLIFVFGDTTGPAENYLASDTMASSTSTDPAAGLVLDFFTNADGTPYFVKIPGVRMGAAEVPHAGIRLDNATYIVCNTGTDRNLPDPNANAYSVLTRFDESTRRFTLLRTLSSRPNGRFITTSLYRWGSDVVIFGLSAYRASDVYLSIVPASTFESGQGTRYFSGLVNGQPTWSTSESDAVPLFVDPESTKTIGNISVVFSQQLGLWLMTYDGGKTPATSGAYFAYAAAPWGPWSDPQLIFNARRDGALGTYIHDPSIVPGDGLTGPTIGDNDPNTTRGGFYAPYLIERFMRVTGNNLSIYYTGSTWNPYTIVLLRSDLTIGTASARRRTARH